MTTLETIGWFCVPLAFILGAALWPLWVLAGIGWAVARCTRPEGEKVTERNRAQALADRRRHRIETVVQTQLAAQGLPDTPGNRALVVMSLRRGR